MEEVTSRDNQIISEALSIAIPIMLRYSLSSSNTMDMLRLLEKKGVSPYPDCAVKDFLDEVVGDLRAGKTFELEKNRTDGVEKSHFEKELKMYLEKIVPQTKCLIMTILFGSGIE